MRTARVLILATLILAATPALASAQAAAPDQLNLKNGGMVLGTVVSMEPGKEVVILVEGTGEQRRFPWAEVANVVRGQSAPPPSAQPPPPPPPPPGREMLVPADGSPQVHIQSDTPGIGLHEIISSISVMGGNGGWATGQVSRPVCMAPCDRVIDGRDGQLFFFGGEGTPPSSRFQLVGMGPSLMAEVKGGSGGKRAGGIVMMGLGGGALAAAVGMFIIGSVGTTTLSPTTEMFTKSTNGGMMAAGGGVLAAGVGLFAGGIALIATSGTHYRFGSPAGFQVGKSGLLLSF